MSQKIVILEDNHERQALMRQLLADRFYTFEAHVFGTSGQAIAYLECHLSDTLVISLDHDLDLVPNTVGSFTDPGTGRDVADFLARCAPHCPVIIHTTNSNAAVGMEMVLHEAGWVTERVVPYNDLEWIEADWFPALRRAIVGPVRQATVTNSQGH